VKILVLGGTKFLGRHTVEAALARGHELTLFNRGETNPELFPEVEKLRGDRDGNLGALEGGGWDAVVDTCGYVPRIVRRSAELLRDRAPHYTFVSSISVYADFSTGPSEGSPLAELEDPFNEDFRSQAYGALKAACERVVSEVYGDAALLVRPGLIVGPNDPTGRFTYWPHRIARGGDVLAPGPPDGAVQFVDVRDLAEWTVQMVERRAAGVYNATGPADRLTMEELLDACRALANPHARLVWVDGAFLLEHEVGEYTELPLWVGDPDWAGPSEVDISKALDAGLSFRPLEETIRATLAEAELSDDAGMKPEREEELLDGWRARA
jgi:2'-hydroxyisoflavone reductase